MFILVLGTVAILNPSSYRFPERPSQTRAPFPGLSSLVSLQLQKPHRLPKASKFQSLHPHFAVSAHLPQPASRRFAASSLPSASPCSSQTVFLFRPASAGRPNPARMCPSILLEMKFPLEDSSPRPR